MLAVGCKVGISYFLWSTCSSLTMSKRVSLEGGDHDCEAANKSKATGTFSHQETNAKDELTFCGQLLL